MYKIGDKLLCKKRMEYNTQYTDTFFLIKVNNYYTISNVGKIGESYYVTIKLGAEKLNEIR